MTAPDRLLTPAYRAIFVAVLFVVCCFNFADRAVFSVLAQSIKVELKLTDLQIGLLQGLSFALLYATLGLPIGRLAERASRVRIIAAATAIWSAMTVACGLATGFGSLMLARVGVGMGEAGFVPPSASLVADHFPRARRASAIALVNLGTPIGSFIGAVAGGAIGAAHGWRAAFLALGLPGLAAALLVLALLREPGRGLVDGHPPDPRPAPDLPAFFRTLARRRALLFVVVGGGLAGFGMTSISNFLPIFLARVHHLPVRDAATLYGAVSAGFLIVGLMLGSFGTDWLATRGDPRWPARGPAAALALSPLLFWAAFSAGTLGLAIPLLLLAGSVMLIFYGPTAGMIQNLLEPRMRATGAALFTMLYTLIGSGLGPTFVGWASDRFAAAAFAGHYRLRCPHGLPPAGAGAELARACAAASADGVRHALMAAVCMMFAAAACYLLASRTLAADMADAQATEGHR